jgi:hypothetical protein
MIGYGPIAKNRALRKIPAFAPGSYARSPASWGLFLRPGGPASPLLVRLPLISTPGDARGACPSQC